MCRGVDSALLANTDITLITCGLWQQSESPSTAGMEGPPSPPPATCWLPPAQAAQGPAMASGTCRDGAPTALGSSAGAAPPLGKELSPHIWPKPPLF